MNQRTMPPAVALRAFEAAARNNSFTLAAAELFLTQGAISRQIRILEEFIGKKLFERFTRRVALTAVGKEYYLDVQRALRDIERATVKAMGTAGRAILTVSVLPTMGASWLMPKLARFVESNPDIDIRLLTSIEPANLQSGDVDAAIRVGCLPGASYGHEHPRIELDMVTGWKGVRAEYLLPDVLVPVMSRKLLMQGAAIARPADLLQYPLIHTASRKYAWGDWLGAHGVALSDKGHTLDFGHFFMGLKAAADGHGIAIVPSVLLPDISSTGELVCPLPADIRSAGNYYLLTRDAGSPDSPTGKFRDWLTDEAHRSEVYDALEFPAPTAERD